MWNVCSQSIIKVRNKLCFSVKSVKKLKTNLISFVENVVGEFVKCALTQIRVLTVPMVLMTSMCTTTTTNMAYTKQQREEFARILKQIEIDEQVKIVSRCCVCGNVRYTKADIGTHCDSYNGANGHVRPFTPCGGHFVEAKHSSTVN